jgi:cysteine-rich repeat protein
MHRRIAKKGWARNGSWSVLGNGALSLMVIAYAGGAQADTISGTLTENTTLTPAASPYSVPGDLDVPPGITLTIEPGVTLVFAVDGVTPNLGAEHYAELVVRGTLKAVGTEAEPNTFQGNAPGRWGGIKFIFGTEPPTLRHLIFRGAFTATRTLAPDLVVHADHLTSSDCSAGVHVWFGHAVIDTVKVSNCYEGIGAVTTGRLEASNVVLINNVEGIHAEGSGSTTVSNATVYGDGTGVYAGGNLTLRNSIVANALVGVDGFANPQILYSNVFNNQTNYVGGAMPGEGTISVDPTFVAAPDDLMLLQGSPCIDSGNATDAPDHDFFGTTRPLDGDAANGAAFDMGAYEFVRAPACGDGLEEGTEECDDGNTNSGDGCAADCSVEPFCGDGNPEEGEECDDGNTTSGDGCASDCTEETGGNGGTGGAGGNGGGGFGGVSGFGGFGGDNGFPFCTFSPQNLPRKNSSWLLAALAFAWGLRSARRNRRT